MTAPIYDIDTGGTVSLSAATAKSILGAKAHANSGLLLESFWLGLTGVTASEVPGSVELCYCTFGANPPGTNSSSVTPVQRSGRVLTAGFTAAKTWSTEPTTITVIRSFPLSPNGGLVLYDFPLGTEPDTALGEGLLLRLNYAAASAVRASMSFSRC